MNVAEEERLRGLAQCMAHATEIARRGIEIDESELTDSDRRLLALGRKLAAAIDKAPPRQLPPNVIDARTRFRQA